MKGCFLKERLLCIHVTRAYTDANSGADKRQGGKKQNKAGGYVMGRDETESRS